MRKASITRLGCALVFLAGAGACSSDASDGSEHVGEVSSELGLPARHSHGSHAGDNGCKNICTLTFEGDQVVRYVSVKESGLTFEETRTIDVHSPGGGATSLVGVVNLGHQKLFSYTASANPGGTGSVDIDWGHKVRGLDEADTEFADGLVTGTINGRTFRPIALDADPATAVFVDGKPAPRSLLHAKGIEKQLQRLEAETKDVIADCETVTTPDENVAPEVVQALAVAGNDPGHLSDTYNTLACDGCKAGVIAGTVAAGVACGLACAASFGLACGFCVGGVAAAVPAGILLCETGPCCPVACGDGAGSTCCFGDEKCLNADQGLCCSSGQQTCAGEACCRSDESCIDQGSQKGRCCQDDLLCGSLNCCEDTETCFDAGSGTCCGAGLECGDVCCGRATDTLSYCMDAATSTCCSKLQVECNGICCPQGQDCLDGLCVVSEEVCEMPCETTGDCAGDSHLRCKPFGDSNCCIYTPF